MIAYPNDAILRSVSSAARRQRSYEKSGVPLATFLESLAKDPPHRVSGPSIFLVGNADSSRERCYRSSRATRSCTSVSSSLPF